MNTNPQPQPQPQPPQILIPRELAVRLVDYLKKRPYEEVHQLIGGLVNAPAANVVEQPE